MMVVFIIELIWLVGEIIMWMYLFEINVIMFVLVWSMIDIVCVIFLIFNLMFIFIDCFFVIKYLLIYYIKMIIGKCKWIILFLWLYVVGILCFFLIE